MNHPKFKKMSLSRAVSLIERDHGGCDSNTCTLSVALTNGYHLVAVDSWIGSGAVSKEFDGVTLPLSLKEVREESILMSKELEHVDCPHCDSVLWLPEDCDYWCDNCGKQITMKENLS